MQFHILSFEGPDPFSRAGGLAIVDGLSQTLAALGFETHLWFNGDTRQPGHEKRALRVLADPATAAAEGA